MGRSSTPTKFATAMGLKAREIRTKQNLTLREAADKSGISCGYISDLENGKRGVSAYILWKLISAYGVAWNEFDPATHIPTAGKRQTKNAGKAGRKPNSVRGKPGPRRRAAG